MYANASISLQEPNGPRGLTGSSTHAKDSDTLEMGPIPRGHSTHSPPAEHNSLSRTTNGRHGFLQWHSGKMDKYR